MLKFTLKETTLAQLKNECRLRKLPVTGKKSVLLERLQVHQMKTISCIRIQKVVRGFIQRRYNRLCGPALMKRGICVNDKDFCTLEEICKIPMNRFFSYADKRNAVYGFDIESLHQLLRYKNIKTNNYTTRRIENPFNRMDIPRRVIKDLFKVLRRHKLSSNTLKSKILSTMNINRRTEQITMELFQTINTLGNYADYLWFWNLNEMQCARLLRELMDVWDYRAMISHSTKQMILPPSGILLDTYVYTEILHGFENCNHLRMNGGDVSYIFLEFFIMLIDVIRRLISNGVDRDSRIMGTNYFLGVLTLVSNEAASSLPWLYESFRL